MRTPCAPLRGNFWIAYSSSILDFRFLRYKFRGWVNNDVKSDPFDRKKQIIVSKRKIELEIRNSTI